MLNPTAMKELRDIAEEQNQQTFSDVIIFLIKEYRSSSSIRSQQK